MRPYRTRKKNWGIDKFEIFAYDILYIGKTLSERVAGRATIREGLSPAESSFWGNGCEVHSGVDPAKEHGDISFGILSSWVRVRARYARRKRRRYPL